MGLDRGAEPDPFSCTDQAEFRQLLKDLMWWAGYATLRPLSQAARQNGTYLPATTVSSALNNDKLPTEEFVRRMVITCGADPETWIEARLILADQKYARKPDNASAPITLGESLDSDDCPYPGLTAFSPDEGEYFFGRESVTATLLDLLGQRLDGSGPLIVGGPSGAGKSSLLRAGLLPALADGRLPGSRHWSRLICTPGDDPLRRLAELLGKPAELDPGEVEVQLRRDPGFAATALRRANPGQSSPVAVLVVDQFEELFTLGQAVPDRRLFVQALQAAAQSADTGPPAAVVVMGVRGPVRSVRRSSGAHRRAAARAADAWSDDPRRTSGRDRAAGPGGRVGVGRRPD
jgi:hypothetical protein